MTLQDLFHKITEFLYAIWTMELMDIAIVLLFIVGGILLLVFCEWANNAELRFAERRERKRNGVKQ